MDFTLWLILIAVLVAGFASVGRRLMLLTRALETASARQSVATARRETEISDSTEELRRIGSLLSDLRDSATESARCLEQLVAYVDRAEPHLSSASDTLDRLDEGLASIETKLTDIDGELEKIEANTNRDLILREPKFPEDLEP